MAQGIVTIKIATDTDDVESLSKRIKGVLGNVDDSVGKTGSFFKKAFSFGAISGVAQSAISAVGNAVKDLVGEAVSASDSLDKFQSTLKFAGFDQKEIDKSSAAVKKYADETVYELSDVANTTAQLAANGIKDYNGLTQAAGNLNAVAGGNKETFKSVGMVLTQTAGTGKLTTENWNQLADAIPGASGMLQEAMKKNGAYTGNFRDAMSEGQITAEEFNKAITDLGMSDAAKEAATSTKTFEGAFGSLQANVISGLQGIIDAIGKDNIIAVINGFSDAVSGGFTFIVEAIKTVAPVIVETISSIGEALQPLLTTIQTNFLPIIVSLWTQFSQVFTNILTIAIPIFEEAITLITGYVTSLIEFWSSLFEGENSIANSFMSAFQSIIDIAMPILQDAITFIMNIISQLTTFWNENGEQIALAVQTIFRRISDYITTVLEVLQPFIQVAWENIKVIFQTVLDVILGIVKVVTSAINGDWDEALTALSDIASSIWEGIKKVFSNTLDAIWEIVSGVLNDIKDAFDEKLEEAKKFVDDKVDAIKGFFEDLGDIDLFEAGKAIIDGFLDGLKKAYEDVKSFIGGIADWIEDHKGPITYDKKLLIPAGEAIMKGLNKGLIEQFSSVQKTIKDISRSIPQNLALGIDVDTGKAVQAMKNMGEKIQQTGIDLLTPQAATGIRSSKLSSANTQSSLTQTNTSKVINNEPTITINVHVENAEDIEQTIRDIDWRNLISERGAMA